MSQSREPLIEGSYTVIGDDLTLEVIGVQSGPAGSVGGTLGAAIEIELDGADSTQLNAVRVWRDGDVSAEQFAVLETLFGDDAASIVEAGRSTRPVRIGNRRNRLSSRDEGVSIGLAEYVQALDGLSRVETPGAVVALLRLVALVRGAQFVNGHALPAAEEIAMAAAGVSEQGRALLREALHEAQALGLMTAAQVAASSAGFLNPVALERTDEGLLLSRSRGLDVSFNAVTESALRLSVAESRAVRPMLQVDSAGLFAQSTTAAWGLDSHVSVRVSRPGGPESELWARARYDGDGSVVAVAPLRRAGSVLEALLLVPERDHVIIDVVPHAAERVVAANVGALGRAYELGRRAGRLERLGREGEAAILWKQCAESHALAGDFQRQKMALSRETMRRTWTPATLVDHLL